MSLQKEGLHLSEVRFTIDEVCKDYHCMKHYHAQDAAIVHNRPSETAVNKILN